VARLHLLRVFCSRIAARPLEDGFVELGGASALDERRDYQR
jgi:hypothetical protein